MNTMSTLKKPLLDEDNCDGYSVLPDVQKLLKLAHSEDPDKQLEVGEETHRVNK